MSMSGMISSTMDFQRVNVIVRDEVWLYNWEGTGQNYRQWAVEQAAESAVREIVGRSKVDSVLYEQREALSTDLVKSVQAQLDRYNAGILVVNVNVQNVQVPEQVQAAQTVGFSRQATWSDYEGGLKVMPPLVWSYYLLAVGCHPRARVSRAVRLPKKGMR